MKITNIFTIACSDVLFNNDGQLSIMNVIEGINVSKSNKQRIFNFYIVSKFIGEDVVEGQLNTVNLSFFINHEEDTAKTRLVVSPEDRGDSLTFNIKEGELSNHFGAYVRLKQKLPKDGKYTLSIVNNDTEEQISEYSFFVKTSLEA